MTTLKKDTPKMTLTDFYIMELNAISLNNGSGVPNKKLCNAGAYVIALFVWLAMAVGKSDPRNKRTPNEEARFYKKLMAKVWENDKLIREQVKKQSKEVEELVNQHGSLGQNKLSPELSKIKNWYLSLQKPQREFIAWRALLMLPPSTNSANAEQDFLALFNPSPYGMNDEGLELCLSAIITRVVTPYPRNENEFLDHFNATHRGEAIPQQIIDAYKKENPDKDFAYALYAAQRHTLQSWIEVARTLIILNDGELQRPPENGR